MNELEKRLKKLEQKIDAVLNPQKWVTVTDGFRGSLKRDFWVRDGVKDEWVKLTDNDTELLARSGAALYPFKLLIENGILCSYRYLKFKPFSIENPPPVDWLAEVGKGYNRYFKAISDNRFSFFQKGTTSKTWLSSISYPNSEIKWLNIEEVAE